MKTIRCPQCNLVNWETVFVCSRCGSDLQDLKSPVSAVETVQAESVGSHLKSQAVPNTVGTAEKNWSEPNDNFSEAGGFVDLGENSNARMPEQNSPLKNGFSNTKRNFTPFTVKTKKGLAICSLVFGIIGLPPISFLFGALLSVILGLIFGTAGFVAGLVLAFLFSPAALISGITALLRANKKPHLFGGKGLAIAGIVCGAVGFLIFPVIAAVAVPNVLAARKSANEASAIATINSLAEAEKLQRLNGGHCTDLQKLVTGDGGGSEKNGFRFLVISLPTLRGDCAITASPVSDSAGSRAFYFSTEDHLIRVKKWDGIMPGRNDSPLK